MSWSRERSAQHYGRYPIEQRGERNKAAQARYRRRHAKRDARVRIVVNILRRQRHHHDDLARLAAALRGLVGTAFSKALATALRRADIRLTGTHEVKKRPKTRHK
jgi:hypothetical protein